MTIQSFVLALEAAVLTAEACLEKRDFINFLHDAQDSLTRRLESLQTDNGFGFLDYEDE